MAIIPETLRGVTLLTFVPKRPKWSMMIPISIWPSITIIVVSAAPKCGKVKKMREAGIPLEGESMHLWFEFWVLRLDRVRFWLTVFFSKVMWNDLDIYLARRDFTNDPVSFPIDEMKAMIDDLVGVILFTVIICGLDKSLEAHYRLFLIM